MLFFNSSDLNFNTDLSGQLRRDLYKDPSKIISKSLESDDSSLESDRYLCDLSIDEEIDVGFFDQLKTPSDEVKLFPSVEETTQHTFGNLLKESVDFKVPITKRIRSAIVIDEDMEEGRKDRPRHQRQQSAHETVNSSEPLTTPVVDPNSPLATSGPVFPMADMDAFSNYFMPDLTRFQQHTEQQHHSASNVVPSTSTLTATSSPSTSTSPAPSLSTSLATHSRREDDNSMKLSTSAYSMAAISSSSSVRHHQHHDLAVASAASTASPSFANMGQDFFNSPMSLHTPRPATASSGYMTGTPSSSHRHPEPSFSPSMTPPRTAPSYTELTPSSGTQSYGSLVPTVVEDHPYHSRGATASPLTSLGALHGRTSFSSAPSPCPSTSSMASCSTVDYKDSPQDLLSFYGTDSVSSQRAKSSLHAASPTSSTRKNRLTKRDKLNRMVDDEKRLTTENNHLQKKVDAMTRDVKNLKEKLLDILRNPKRKSDHDGREGGDKR